MYQDSPHSTGAAGTATDAEGADVSGDGMAIAFTQDNLSVSYAEVNEEVKDISDPINVHEDINLTAIKENLDRKNGKIGFSSYRKEGVVGDHSVIFDGEHERIALSHIAENRDIFAKGALKAAEWGQDKEPGLFSMIDVLGF